MEKIIYRLTLDTHKNGIQKTLQGFETEDKIARRIAINLTSRGDAYKITDDVVAVMYVTTPNATEPSINECFIEDNTILYDVFPIVEEGITEMQMKLISVGVNGAESVLASPRFALEVTESGTSDSGSKQHITFTALENAVAKAHAVYNKRLERVEIDDECVFRAYFGDGTVYENDELKNVVYDAIGKSEENAKTSETNANASAVKAKESENNAKTSETNAKASEDKANEYMEKAFYGTPDGYKEFVDNVKMECNRINSDIAVERARINNIVALEEGSTTGDAELQDIRVGADGTVYQSAGEAVRTQVGQLSSEIVDLEDGVDDVAYSLVSGEKISANISWENGSVAEIRVGAKIANLDTTPYITTRKRMKKSCILYPSTITISEGYSFTLFKVDDDDIILSYSLGSVSSYVKQYELTENCRCYIIAKKDDESDISSVDIGSIININYEVIGHSIISNRHNLSGIKWENGTVLSMAEGDNLSKWDDQTYIKKRKRLVEAVKLKNCEIIVKKTCSVCLLDVDENGTIIRNRGYKNRFTIGKEGYYYLVLKANNDGDLTDTNANSIVKINYYVNMLDIDRVDESKYFHRENVYFTPPFYGAEYIPCVSCNANMFNYDTSVETLNNAWISLARESNGYLTTRNMGKDQTGVYDVIQVSAKANGYTVNKLGCEKPKIIITTGTHGNEKASVNALYYLFYDIVHNWRNNKVLEYLRWCVDFEIAPLVSPYGYQNKTYGNGRGVNINHNFDDDNHYIGYGESSACGEFAFSEKESQYVKEMIDNNTDAIFHIDFHTQGTEIKEGNNAIYAYHDFDPMYGNGEYNMLMVNAARNHIDFCNRHFKHDYSGISDNDTTTYGYFVFNSLGGHCYSYSMSKGVYGHVTECGCNLPNKETQSDFYSGENLTASVRSFGQWLEIILETIYHSVNH